MSDNIDADSSTEPTTTRSRSEPPEGDVVLEGEADAEAIIDAIERARHPDTEEILEDDARHIDAMRRHMLPALRLPGFGEPLEDCGEYVLSALRYCVRSGKTHEFKRNCLRYDCPQHAPYAVRRRAAGSSDGSGVAPQLKSLILRLYHNRNEMDHHYHHLFISPPDDYIMESEEPLDRAKEVIRDILDELGAQGLVAYHPYRGDDEDRKGDDRGFWKDLLFHRSNWEEAREDLKIGPHFHVIAVAPHVDVSVTKEIERRTGWVIHRRTNDDGSSISYDPARENDKDDDAMCRVLSYVLSHTGIYDTEDGQRRLAAWMKGPDVASTEVYPKVKRTMQERVFKAAEDTIGIASPSLECDCDFHEAARDHDPSIDLEDVESGAVSLHDWPWPDGPNGEADLPRKYQDLPRENRTDLPNERTGLGSSSSVAGDVQDATPRFEIEDDPDEIVDDEEQTCGAYLKHISQAGEYLLDAEWRHNAPYVDELENAYVDYVSYMESKDLDPLEGVPTLPEETDGPPPD